MASYKRGGRKVIVGRLIAKKEGRRGKREEEKKFPVQKSQTLDSRRSEERKEKKKHVPPGNNGERKKKGFSHSGGRFTSYKEGKNGEKGLQHDQGKRLKGGKERGRGIPIIPKNAKFLHKEEGERGP